MLRWAIPEFRLPLDILENEIGLLVRMGIEFRCGIIIGKDKSIVEIKDEFDAVIIATGCPRHGKLNIEGEDAPGIYYGLPFLRSVRDGNPPPIGKMVVVIGGGNVAVDAAQTCLRLGAESVTLFSLESEQDLPAFPWAVQSALSEGVKLECAWGNPTFHIVDGVLKGMDFQKCLQVFDASGCFQPSFDDCQLKTIKADTIIVAVGQSVDLTPFEKVGLLEKGTFQADALTLQTRDKKIFLAGDVFDGPSSVVQAMARGRQAAESVDRYLQGEHLRYGRIYPGAIETEFEINTDCGSKDLRFEIPTKRYQGRGDFNEIEQGLDAETARKEAARCYSCGQPFGKYRTCWFCLPCEVECPEDALWVEVPYLLR